MNKNYIKEKPKFQWFKICNSLILIPSLLKSKTFQQNKEPKNIKKITIRQLISEMLGYQDLYKKIWLV